MTTFTLASVNANNLFSRWNFSAEVASLPRDDRDISMQVEFTTGPDGPNIHFRKFLGKLVDAKSDEQRRRLADRILAIDADVIALQEVENLLALREFADDFLERRWRFHSLVEGNDDRLIDVALLSKLPLGEVASHRHHVHPDDPSRAVFGRDLPGVDVLAPDRSRRLLRVYNTHMKSNFVPFTVRGDAAREAAAEANHARRRRQSDATVEILTEQHPPGLPWVLCGDFNADPDHASLAPIVDGPLTPVDLLDGLRESQPAPASRNPEDVPAGPRWTHRFSESNAPDHFGFFDQLWGSPGLDTGDPTVHRRETWTRSGTDHDPVSVVLDV